MTGRFASTPHRMTQQDGYRMIQRRARQAGIKTRAWAIIRCAQPASPITSRATVRWNTLQRWLHTPRRAPRSSTTGATMRRHSTSMRK